jgi:hypothetical protein
LTSCRLIVNDLQANTDLLDHELPNPRFVDESYLRWLYEENPHGHASSGASTRTVCGWRTTR